jgi:hypothetical protein
MYQSYFEYSSGPYEFKMGFATGCFGHRVFLVTHDAVKYSNGH